MGTKTLKKKSFTLIEMIVVLGVVALALPALFSVLFVVLQQQVKVIRLSEVKRQGDAVLQLAETKVRDNAKDITNQLCSGECRLIAVCRNPGDSATGDDFIFNNSTDNWFEFSNNEDNIVMYNSPNGGGAVTKSNTIVDNFTFTCYKKDTYSPPRVTLQFTICYKNDPLNSSCNTIRPEDKASMTYSATIHLRSIQ